MYAALFVQERLQINICFLLLFVKTLISTNMKAKKKNENIYEDFELLDLRFGHTILSLNVNIVDP